MSLASGPTSYLFFRLMLLDSDERCLHRLLSLVILLLAYDGRFWILYRRWPSRRAFTASLHLANGSPVELPCRASPCIAPDGLEIGACLVMGTRFVLQ